MQSGENHKTMSLIREKKDRKELIIVRGGGDIATGVIHKLHQCGYPALVLETEQPSAIRRHAAFSEAAYEGVFTVEGVTCVRVLSTEQAWDAMDSGRVALMTDPQGEIIRKEKPFAVVDAILAKRNLGTTRDMAPLVIGLGPGFTAGEDVDAVIETMRGHQLGRIIRQGQAIPDTGVPGTIEGIGTERVIHAAHEGIIRNVKSIADFVVRGETIAWIEGEKETYEVAASISGILRGLIRDGYPVTKGFKIADIDPRRSEYENCFTISDKARCIAGGVLEAVAGFEAGMWTPRREGL